MEDNVAPLLATTRGCFVFLALLESSVCSVACSTLYAAWLDACDVLVSALCFEHCRYNTVSLTLSNIPKLFRSLWKMVVHPKKNSGQSGTHRVLLEVNEE